MEKYSNKGAKVADYGCGGGDFLNYAGAEYEIYGYDISPAAIATAQSRFPAYKDNFFTTEQFRETSLKFDAICMWDVIEHLEQPGEVIEALKDKMNDKGIIILSTPNIGSFHAKITKAKWPFMTPLEHLCFFSKKSIRIFGDKHSLKILCWFARGKWVNIGFLIHKFNKVNTIKIPHFIEEAFCKGFLASWKIYVPTHDIQYVVFQKRRMV